MEIITKETADEFIKLCEWTYGCWVRYKSLFDDNEDLDSTVKKCDDFFLWLREVMHQYMFMEMGKLHDKAIMNGSFNLTFDYMVKYGDWTDEEAVQISSLHERLTDLWNHLKKARNKVLAHNDLITIVKSHKYGQFPKGKDLLYFDALEQFTSLVHKKWFGHPRQFGHFYDSDIQLLLKQLRK